MVALAAPARPPRLARTKRQLTRRWRPTVEHQLTLAATAYGVPSATLIRKAHCESGLNPYARNPQSAATGILQFLPSTWRSTPYGRYSITTSPPRRSRGRGCTPAVAAGSGFAANTPLPPLPQALPGHDDRWAPPSLLLYQLPRTCGPHA